MQSLAPPPTPDKPHTPTTGASGGVLAVKHVIGTTATSAPAFCVCVAAGVAAWTAGAGAVLARLEYGPTQDDQDGTGSKEGLRMAGKRFFCGAASANSSQRKGGGSGSPRKVQGEWTDPGEDEYTEYSSNGGGHDPFALPPRRRGQAKTASCVALSPSGTLLAVGETGLRPQVLLYSTGLGGSGGIDGGGSRLVAALDAHGFGVKLASFSACGRYLATLGTAHDGFLHVWAVNSATGTVRLCASNRCISAVNDMKWVEGGGPGSPPRLVTAGKRHLRVWSLTPGSSGDGGDSADLSPGKGVLAGRNLVLGEFAAAASFVALVAVGPGLLVAATDQGELATIEDTGPAGVARFVPRLAVGWPVMAMDVDVDEHLLWVTGPTAQDMK